ncbi:MAG: class I SAM-dependent methyltransferase [Bdellovibrionales bacterium]|nr:class I SAM-dependent methyltransferase [Bdellovibrionales bacterium]
MSEPTQSSGPYELLDSGDGRKLERVGEWIVERQSAAAFWRPRLPAKEWAKAHAVHQRSDKGGGHWEFKRKLPESWITELGGLRLKTKLTSFGHLGFFAEQASEWAWFRETARKVPNLKILNLFAYTGGSSLSLAQGGAEVTHVDAAKGIVDWSKENLELNALPRERIRYVVEDCLAFLKKEERRGRKYDGVLLDPPSFGRGANKEVFKIEDDIGHLLDAIAKVLVPKPSLVHMSCHSPGFTPEVLRNLLTGSLPLPADSLEVGEMFVPESGAGGRRVPSGAFCRFRV